MPKKPHLKLNLALQGGGAHGAFTWGVLDRLLEEEDIEIVGISGTSAGAMNAAVMIEGYVENGRQGAKDQLTKFWEEISGVSRFAGSQMHSPFGHMGQAFQVDYSAMYSMFDVLTRMFSPYETNPLNIHPMRGVLENIIDFERLKDSHIQLFVTATNVETGQARIFKCDEITVDVLLASACIPSLFQAVEIEGTPFWDGGYMGNPSIWPLFYKTQCNDILLVQINPIERPGTPKKSIDIINRLNEISFNSSLLAELRAINFVKDLIKQGKLKDNEYRDVNMHMVNPPGDLHEMTASSKLNASWDFFTFLHKIGRERMEHWIKSHKSSIGKASTLDIAKTFLTHHEHITKKDATDE
jgi:NTE family protein